MNISRCDPFWVENPSVLLNKWNDFFPFTDTARKCTSTALNSLTRFGIYLGLILSIVYMHGSYLGISVAIAVLSVAAYYGMKQNHTVREGFENEIVTPTLFTEPGATSPNLVGGGDVSDKLIADVIGSKNRTYPTPNNPYMSVLVTDILDNPKKGPAISIDTPEMQRELSNNTQNAVYGDPDDVFQHTQNQRTWVVPPITTVPNDAGSFQNWLFRVPGLTCKEGNLAACQTATEGSPITWLSAP
jgi:hypothetical protein